ncbi:MAG: EAL domain-containing protein, partial [Gammaproteobacteria bacterium]|nr:EAL domain-containing protein [Gammaproteobacteria bacterium]
TFRLIILNDSKAEAERLISIFQSADRPCRPTYVNDEPRLNKLLEEKSWDLLIAHSDTQSLPPVNAIKLIKKLNRDVPVIILADEVGPKLLINSMKQGAKDVVKVDDDQHLLLVVARELENRQQREITRRAERQLRDVERRNQRLLDRSKDAIAFIQDGMYLYVNDSFAELFGYKDRDDIECMPIMDMIDDNDQSSVKRALKAFTLHHESDSQKHRKLEFNAITQSGKKKPIHVDLHMAHYDEESCIQFIVPTNIVHDQELEAELESVKYTDQATGLFNRQYILEKLDSAIDDTNNDKTSIFLYVDIDNYNETVESVVGVGDSDQVLAKIASFLQKHTMESSINARFADNVFVSLLPGNQTSSNALKNANELCKEVAGHLFEIEKKTLRLTLSVGIVIVNETSSSTSMVVDQAIKAITYLRKQNDIKGVGNGAHIYQQEGDDDAQNTVIDIQAALEKKQFRLLFQPIVSLRGDEKEHYEVLVRILNKDNEALSLDALLKTVEGAKASNKIDRWMVLETFKQLAAHHEKNNKTQVFVALNIQSIFNEGLVAWLKVAFTASKLSPSDVIFQIREADITQHVTAVKTFVNALHDIGSRFCISHFGCSLNPMTLLEHIDADYIKIDSSFTQEIQDNPKNSETLEELMSQLNELQKATIIPMVENAAILAKLWQLGTHYIQGSYLQEPGEKMDFDFSNE